MSSSEHSSLKKNASKTRQTRSKATWINLSPAEASGEKNGALSARRVASEVYVDKLTLTPIQKEQILSLYRDNMIQDYQFSSHSEADQSQAAVVLGMHDLHIGSSEDITTRWGMRWSDSGKAGRGGGSPKRHNSNATRRILTQCYCGYDERVAGSKKRTTPLPFTGCTAHAEITFEVKSQKILRIRGYFEHNSACKDALYERFPPIPLHPDVFSAALQQLRSGSSVTAIQEHNRTLYHAMAYPALKQDHSIRERYRWLLRSYDMCSLYRQFNRLQGIKVTEPAHLNIHEWLDPASPQYNATLREAVFYYQARQEQGDRFKACIATPEMREAAWEHGHNSQIILDGTFGICDRKVLLFIVMGIDNEKKGVPLAFLFFSAPSANRFTASGYNTQIIAELLGEWRKELGDRKGEKFDVRVAITDTDLKERGALLLVFPGIWLLICKFHLRQSWQNQRNKVLRGSTSLHNLLRRRIAVLEDCLVATNTILEAQTLIADEQHAVALMKERDPTNSSLYDTAHAHLSNYLLGYWTTTALWSSWSDFGRKVAASRLDCPFEGVLPTTNHLESFNGVLKRKYLSQWQKGGRRLRLDVLLMLLVTKILPAIFRQRQMERADRLWWADVARRRLQGGEKLIQAGKTSNKLSTAGPVAYLTPDTERDTAACRLLEHNQLATPEINAEGTYLTFQCYSSLAVAHEENPVIYTIRLHFNGLASCTCPDWMSRGGACKHLRAALAKTNDLRQKWPSLPPIPLPDTFTAARLLQEAVELVQMPTTLQIPRPDAVNTAAVDIEEMLENSSDDVYVPEEHSVDSPSPTPSLDPGPASDTDSEAPFIERDVDFDVQSFDVVSGSQNALNSQAISRTFHDFELALPKLSEWTEYLQHATHLPAQEDRNRAKRYNDHLVALSTQLQRLILASEPRTESLEGASTRQELLTSNGEPVEHGGVEEKTAVEGKPSAARKRPMQDILPPSPEKAQKRKKSYGSH
ncbi:hypothetical protein V5O48_017535 [Marasmius crinis-equi]|uniref:SWIM-type domain-containing protein n=1 Tax=Marasmius crinis-equi TaxID=585013 RepID=A0ABR3ENP9_9AGAR